MRMFHAQRVEFAFSARTSQESMMGLSKIIEAWF
jgi:hypothetical protein